MTGCAPRSGSMISGTGRAKVVVLENGPAKRGTWQTAEVDILKDYQAAFGTKPPKRAGIVIMCDSDTTGGATRASVDDLEVRRPAHEINRQQ